MEYTTNAPKGVELLNQRKPGWRDEINVNEFNIRSIVHCAVAQLYGSYWDGLTVLFPETENKLRDLSEMARGYGFTVDLPFDEQDDDDTWNVLQAEWMSLLSE